MKEEILTDTLLRQYLLGKVDDEERERIEKLFITDSQARDRVLAARQDLIEDYLEDSLTNEDQEIFLLHYAQTPEQRRKLRINKSIKDWALTEVQAAPGSSSIWTRLIETPLLRPAFVVSIAVACLIAIFVGYIWLRSTFEHRAIQNEVAQLNTPENLSLNPSQMVSLRLTPVTVRNGENENQITRLADTRVVELRLVTIEGGKYQLYRVAVRQVGVKEPITTFDLQGEHSNTIHLRLPARILANGSYRIELSGIAPDGSTAPIAEYVFTVTVLR